MEQQINNVKIAVKPKMWVRSESCCRCGKVINTAYKEMFRRNSNNARRKIYCISCYEGLFI